MVITPNMTLVAWTSEDDDFDHNQLATDLALIDGHDHSPGKGKKLNAATSIISESITDDLIAPATITGDKIAGGTITGGNIAENTITADKFISNLVFPSGHGITLNDASLDIITGSVILSSGNFSSSAGGLILANGNITMTSGSVNMTNGDIGITLGTVTLHNGNLDILQGDIIMSNGNLEVNSGSITGSAGLYFSAPSPQAFQFNSGSGGSTPFLGFSLDTSFDLAQIYAFNPFTLALEGSAISLSDSTITWLNCANSGGNPAVGFMGATPVLRQISGGTLGGVISGLVDLGLFTS